MYIGEAEVDYSQGLPTPALGTLDNPGVKSPSEESVFNSTLLLVTSLMAGIYLARALPREKHPSWQIMGWFGLSGSFYGAINGVSGILHHFAHKEA